MIKQESLATVAQALDVDPKQLAEDAAAAQRMLDHCHTLAVKGGWWHDPATGEKKERNKGEMLMLMVSEVSEAMEGERKGLPDDKLPHRPMPEVELADLVIRAGDYSTGHDYDLIPAMVEKMAFNLHRADHKAENRLKAGGKTF